MASLLVIGLFERGDNGTVGEPLGEPLVIEVIAPWPQTRLVLVPSRATDTGRGPSMSRAANISFSGDDDEPK